MNKFSLDVGKWIPTLAAVSVYSKSGKPQILITINSQLWDAPTITGYSYFIDLYKVVNEMILAKIVDISSFRR